MTCQDCARLEAQAAAMRSFLEKIVQEWTEPTQTCANATVDMRYFLKQVEKALSSDAGKELLAKVEALEADRKYYQEEEQVQMQSKLMAIERAEKAEAKMERMEKALREVITVVDSADWSRDLALIRGRANEALRELTSRLFLVLALALIGVADALLPFPGQAPGLMSWSEAERSGQPYGGMVPDVRESG